MQLASFTRYSSEVMRSSSSADFEVELRRVSSTWDEKQIELADPVRHSWASGAGEPAGVSPGRETWCGDLVKEREKPEVTRVNRCPPGDLECH